jgi:membrane protein DedA with SNARE-associated domain
VVLAIGMFLEGESILTVVGFAAHLGHLKLEWAILAALVGSLARDQFYFLIGRVKGAVFLSESMDQKHSFAQIIQLSYNTG